MVPIFGQQTIRQVKMLPPGSVVTTTGIITSGPDFGTIRYMQDADAGIAIYSSSLSALLSGDSILITGVVSSFKGQLQLSPVISHQLIASGLPLPPPRLKTLDNQDPQLFESMRVSLPCTGIASCEPTFDSGWYRMFDQRGNESRLIITQDNQITGMEIPETAITSTGIWTKSENHFQLLGQKITNASEGNCHIIQPGDIRFLFDEMHLSWQLDEAIDSWVDYGQDYFDQHEVIQVINHAVNYKPQNLEKGKIYKGRFGQRTTTGDTIYSPITFFSAISDPSPVEIFFNRQIDTSFSDGSAPDGVGSSVIESVIIESIDQVKSTLDIAMYNSSRDPIIQAVTRAVQRGVVVRYLADDETGNSALQGTLSFPVLFRTGDGIMHNKFIIGDADDADNAWLWTGSTNFSVNQLASDPNHAYIFHDQALALNYRREFDEFWGELANHTDGTYGEGKNDNSVHRFRIGSAEIESYFSPSDETNCHILDALSSADHHLEIGLLLLTKENLVDKLIELYEDGIDIRVIVEDEESSSLALSRLHQAGVPIVTHDFSPIYHHKYAIIDEGFPQSDPQVITGSHNWTFSADNINDENTLIVHDQSFANIFRQEFEARWNELVGTSTSDVDVKEYIKIHPNPASDHLIITNSRDQRCTATMFNANGNIVAKHRLGGKQEIDITLDDSLPNGLYILHWSWPGDYAISRFTIQR